MSYEVLFALRSSENKVRNFWLLYNNFITKEYINEKKYAD